MPPHLPWLDYAIPDELATAMMPGQLVKIIFRKTQEFGIVSKILDKPNINTTKLKSISAVVVQRPLLNLAQLNFLQEMSELYATPLGFLVKSSLLPIKKTKIQKIQTPNSNQETQTIKTTAKPQLTIYKNYEEKRLFLNRTIPLQGQSLILVPELSDIENILELLTPEQRVRSIIISSEISEKNLFDRWLEIWNNPDLIVVGTRRAFFLPWFNLQTIILDDESNFANKSWDMAPRFHARDAALNLAFQHGAKLHLLAHTPSVETFYFVTKGVYDCEQVRIHPVPTALINMRDERRGGNYNILSNEATDEIIKNTAGVTFLYLNRRGSAHYIACRDCGVVAKCARCKSLLTYYQNKGRLLCHHCGQSEQLQAACQQCGGTTSKTYGAGTEQLYLEVKKLIGDKRLFAKIDTDEEKTLNETAPGTIIIGTRYAWSRIPWLKINLCVFVDADTTLFIPEYKAGEELWHQLRDASFRLGSTKQLFIQTSHLEHNIFQSLNHPEKFYEAELTARKLFGYSPFNFLVKLFAGFPTEPLAQTETKKFKQILAQLTKDNGEVTLSSAVPSFPAVLKGMFWYIILAKIRYNNYKKWTKLLVNKLPIGWKVDPNPNSILSI